MNPNNAARIRELREQLGRAMREHGAVPGELHELAVELEALEAEERADGRHERRER